MPPCPHLRRVSEGEAVDKDASDASVHSSSAAAGNFLSSIERRHGHGGGKVSLAFGGGVVLRGSERDNGVGGEARGRCKARERSRSGKARCRSRRACRKGTRGLLPGTPPRRPWRRGSTGAAGLVSAFADHGADRGLAQRTPMPPSKLGDGAVTTGTMLTAERTPTPAKAAAPGGTDGWNGGRWVG